MNYSDVISICSLVFSVISLVAIVPLVGKMFFSSHSVEYRPIEELAAIRQGLGIDDDPKSRVEEKGREVSEEMLGGVEEEFEQLVNYNASYAKLKKDEEEMARSYSPNLSEPSNLRRPN